VIRGQSSSESSSSTNLTRIIGFYSPVSDSMPWLGLTSTARTLEGCVFLGNGVQFLAVGDAFIRIFLLEVYALRTSCNPIEVHRSLIAVPNSSALDSHALPSVEEGSDGEKMTKTRLEEPDLQPLASALR
jgi:hypothetical protein